jgi:UDP-glucose 4-epimerase
MANYLVTGVAGFIGAAIAEKLLRKGHKVVGMDNLSTGYIDHIPKGVEFYEIGVHEVKIL